MSLLYIQRGRKEGKRRRIEENLYLDRSARVVQSIKNRPSGRWRAHSIFDDVITPLHPFLMLFCPFLLVNLLIIVNHDHMPNNYYYVAFCCIMFFLFCCCLDLFLYLFWSFSLTSQSLPSATLESSDDLFYC